MRNLAEMFLHRVAASPDKMCLKYQDDTATWHALYKRAAGIAYNLRKAGIGRGDVVAVYCAHTPATISSIFAVAMCDAVFTLIGPFLKKDQIVHQISDCRAKAVVVAETNAAAAKDILAGLVPHIIAVDDLGTVVEGAHDTSSLCAPEDWRTSNIPADVACYMYTSGSTGKAKGVVVPHRTLLDGARIVSGYLKITERDNILSMLPLSFDYGLNQILGTVYVGARITLFNYAMPWDLIETLDTEQITAFAAVPTLWPQLLDDRYLDFPDKPEFPNLRYVTTAGGMHSEAVLRKLTAFFPHSDIIVMYGLTESFRSTYLPPSEVLTRIGSIGKPVPEVEILVLDDDMRPCAPGQIGELYHRGAFVNYGYLNNPELTAEKYVALPGQHPGCRAEYAVRSGDLASMDEDGFIYYHGRADRQIKCNGFRISPDEIEDAATAHADIRNAAAFGIPHPDAGQVVVLAYETASSAPPSDAEILHHMRQVLPTYAVPRHIMFFERLPLNANGKINYEQLKQAFAAQGKAS